MTVKYTSEQVAWLRENYGAGDINDTLDSFEAAFGWKPTGNALYQKAFKLGLVKRRRSDERGKLVERTVRWTSPECEEYDRWMRENDRGHSIAAVVDDFETAFGFRLTRTQVSQWRARNGVGRKTGRCNRGNEQPIGAERDTGKGYILVKVAEKPAVPLSKDNWRMKHHLVWEQAHGKAVPDGHEIVFADKDHSNFDPENLVAVDKKLVGIINGNSLEYWDAESLAVAVGRARLMSKVRDVESGGARTCGVCGAFFEPTSEQRKYTKPVQTCPKCRAMGLKAKGKRRGAGKAVCAVCGAEFERGMRSQKRCPECIRRAPKHSAAKQRKREYGVPR